MNARFLTLAAVVCLTALTGCSGGMGSNIFGRGAPCGASCCPSTGPAYDYASEGYGDYRGGGYDEGYGSGNAQCGCADSYAGYDSGMNFGEVQGGPVQYDGGYQGSWGSGGQMQGDGSYIVPGSQSTNLAPVPARPMQQQQPTG